MVESRSSGRPLATDSAVARVAFIKVARTHFAKFGYTGTAMTSVAQEAGYTPTALRHYFENKAELYAAVFATTSNEIYPQIVQHLHSPTMADAIEGSMGRMLEISKEFPEFIDFLYRTPSELYRHPELREKVEVRESFQEFFYSSLISLGRKTGELNKLTDELQIMFFRTVMQGWIYEGIFSNDITLKTQIALVKLLERL